MVLGWVRSVPSKLFPRRSDTALLILQPHALLQKEAKNSEFRRSFEAFVSNARERGAFVAYVGCSNWLWMELIALSHSVFVFRTAKGYNRVNENAKQEALSLDVKERLLKEKNARIAGSGQPANYTSIAVVLGRIFSEIKARRVLVCGGLDRQTTLFFMGKLKVQPCTLELLAASSLVQCEGGLAHFFEAAEREGISVRAEDGGFESLLDLF